MNILFTTDQYPPAVNGIVTHVSFVKKELERRGHHVYILTTKRTGSKAEDGVFFLPAIPFPLRPIDPIAIPYSNDIKNQLLRLDIDIIHNHFFLSGYVGFQIAKQKNLPLLLTLHLTFNTYVDWIFPHSLGLLYPLSDMLARSYFNHHDLIAAPSEKGKKEVVRIGGTAPVEVIHNGIPLPDPTRFNTGTVRKKYHIPPKAPVIVVSGRIDDGKNVDLAVDAFAHIKRSVPDAVLVLAGDGHLRSQIEQQVRALSLSDSVIFTGMLNKNDLYGIYNASTLMLFTSTSDMLPTVIIEALAFGKPVVTIHDDAPLELIKNNENGLVAKTSASDLAEAVIKIVTSPKILSQMERNARASSKQYSLEKNVDALLERYERLIQKQK